MSSVSDSGRTLRRAAYAALARRAEAVGFDVISVFHDLLFQPAIFPRLVMAGATERVRLGPAALDPSTLHPAELAGQAAALDRSRLARTHLPGARRRCLARPARPRCA